ncbi:hypothetical protein ACPCSC_30260 [Streptomyces lavendulocolor]|uniref:hypothetical protein n=1 Tax=Streptomyces lavendulocolor TaxID=67316 RepID=UPI003C2E8F6D
MSIPEPARFDPDTTPDWLVEAEEEERKREALENRRRRARAAGQAQQVNHHLASLGITPAWPATADGRWVSPALLAYGNIEEGTYAVWADYRDDHGVVLRVGGDGEGRGAEFAGELRTVADVVRARREGPVARPRRESNWRRQAEEEAGRSLGDLSPDTAALCHGLRGLTAALLARSGQQMEVATGTEVDLDCEFLPGDLTPGGLVSIGLTAGPGRSLYAVNADMDVAAVRRVKFQRDHVWPHLPLTADGALDRSHPHVLGYADIRRRVEEFFAGLGDDVTLWVYSGAQDVIRLHTLWRNDWSVMPDFVPEWADDLSRLRRAAGGVKLPQHAGRHHHALDDAEHQRQARAYLRGLLG